MGDMAIRIDLLKLLDEVKVASRIEDHAHRHERIDAIIASARPSKYTAAIFWYCWIHDSQRECRDARCDLGHWETRSARPSGQEVQRG